MTFHAKQEFPDYPYVNATYADVKAAYKAIHNKVVRFAGEGSRLPALVPHRLPISKAGGCKALVDCGVTPLSPGAFTRWRKPCTITDTVSSQPMK